ncbi:MAG: tetratricopeptide repeat protein [Gammaproteobacteria bacterium]|nr:tetratricopeptide repeat protein [Gammaproteobacteria bacterium]MDH4252978.1 tetratricopeptide repeat protein [Gammaproteobacteria bacterium]MDH5308600.1 tetratricopeptide repeat protein [Gammaproteobacteria bacterium]
MDDLSEKEQIERIRGWWSENGTYVIVGIIVGSGLLFGINYYRNQTLDTQLEASSQFEALAQEVAENRLEPAQEIAAGIYADYPDSIYAAQTRLAMARLYMDQGRDQEAAAELQALLASGGNSEIQLVGRLRLARILLYQGKPEAVLTLLDGQEESAFSARFQEVRGDAYADLGRYAEARTAYAAALADERSSQLIDTALVNMKVSDLPDDAAAEMPVDPTAEAGTPDETGDETGE